MIMNNEIIPYEGIGDIKLAMKLEEVRSYLISNKISFDQWTDSNKGIETEIPWTNIRINKSILLTFVKGVLFEISLENEYSGCLSNGIYVGMDMVDAKKIDSSMQYNDDEEYYVSVHGYWIGDEIESGKIISITIFLPEVEIDDDAFWNYEWLEKYL